MARFVSRRAQGIAAGAVVQSEKAFMRAVVELARWSGWLVYHTQNARQSVKGFPDLVLVRAGQLLFVELKTEVGRLTPEQCTWLERLAAVPGVHAVCWTPAHWPDIEAQLRRRLE